MSLYFIIFIISMMSIANSTDIEEYRSNRSYRVKNPPTHICGENEQWSTSGIDCLTCENYQYTKCAVVYESKCYCFDGYVRNSQNKCVPTSECEKTCPINERYTNQTPCENKCSEKNQISYRCNCTLANGCVCDTGYVRCEFTNSCVPQDYCNLKCQPNEVPSYNWCEKQCENNQVVDDRICPLILVPACMLKCVCGFGYIRDSKTQKCIPVDECT